MKYLFNVAKEFISKDFQLRSYLYSLIILSIGIYVNYGLKFKLLHILESEVWVNRFFNYLMPCVFIWYTVWLFHYTSRKKKHYYISSDSIWKPLMIMFAIALALSSGLHKEIASLTETTADQAYSLKILTRLRGWVWLPLCIIVIRWMFDKDDKKWYGIFRKPKSYKPYFIMLLFVLPLVLMASTQADFIQAYPRYKPWQSEYAFGMGHGLMTGIFEIAYGLDFVLVEWIYRGLLVIGVSRIIGKQAVLPAAALYCVMHFGKPMAEAISSFFGGYLLGIIAYHTRSIRGGIIVHLGLAWMMEICGLVSYYFFRA